MQDNIQFSLATIDDIQDLIDVQNQAFYHDYIKYGDCPGYGRGFESMKSSVKNCIVYKIIINETMVGDMIIQDHHDGTYFLRGLCLVPAYENKGIGQAAMRFLDEQFKSARLWSLETPADNERNLHFYKKCGFHVTNEYNVGTVKIVSLEKHIPI